MTADSQSTGESGFRKKSFTPRTFLTGTIRFVRTLPALARARRSGRLSDQFVEKIMLAATAVNECQYCTRFHRDLARETGVDEATVDAILERDVGSAVGEYERPALVFALRYAETDEDPGEDAVADLEAAYGPEVAVDVQAYLRAIYWGNLLGNSYDALRWWLRTTVEDGRERLRGAIAGFRSFWP